jgi:CheY-like chemotaxis protein
MEEDDAAERRSWQEGPEAGAPAEGWLTLGEDELLHKIETVGSQHDVDDRLLEVVASDRHFFIRQEAAKRIRRKKLLFPYEDDRHIGQILVRHLNRREDVTYLERLVARSTHGEVRKAAQVQLGRLRKRLEDQDRREARRDAPETATWKVAVVHSEAAVRQAIAETLRAPEYQVTSYAAGVESSALLALPPHLLLAGGDDLLGAGLQTLIRARDRPLPVVALCDAGAADRLPQMLAHGADEFMLLPLLPELLEAKVRALLHLAHLTPHRAEVRKAKGLIGEDGVLPLLKLCEDEQLTCRLVVTTEAARWFVDFVGGEMTEAGGSPPADEDDALATILTVHSGTYEMIEALPLDEEPDALGTQSPYTGVVATSPATISPAAAGARTERVGWQVPDVDATLLGWAVHFVVEQAWAHLGTTATAGLLRRTLQDGRERHPILRVFTVEPNAHVGVDLTQGARMPADAVGATAQWMAVLVAAVRRIAPDAATIDVRDATRIVGAALEQVDFYTAYDRAAAAQKDIKPASHVIGRIIPTRRTD